MSLAGSQYSILALNIQFIKTIIFDFSKHNGLMKGIRSFYIISLLGVSH